MHGNLASWSIGLCLHACVCCLCYAIILLVSGDCLAWDSGSRSRSCRLDSLSNKVVEIKNLVKCWDKDKEQKVKIPERKKTKSTEKRKAQGQNIAS